MEYLREKEKKEVFTNYGCIDVMKCDNDRIYFRGIMSIHTVFYEMNNNKYARIIINIL